MDHEGGGERDLPLVLRGRGSCGSPWRARNHQDEPSLWRGEWWIKQGNVLNLAELCWWAKDRLTAYEIYKLHICLPIYCHKKMSSESAKRLSGLAEVAIDREILSAAPGA